MFTLGVLTISDFGSLGQRNDLSGPEIQDFLGRIGFSTRAYDIVPDERDQIEARLKTWADDDNLDLVVTTGGTGIGPRDVTPEATMQIVNQLIPGIPELMRSQTAKKTPTASLSRSVAGVRGRTLIINLPGSPQGVRECLEVLQDILPHAIAILTEQITEHRKS